MMKEKISKKDEQKIMSNLMKIKTISADIIKISNKYELYYLKGKVSSIQDITIETIVGRIVQ